jgi:phosphopantothenoylcysteine decarboxylase / phosphopantothenate---cysteine ligase
MMNAVLNLYPEVDIVVKAAAVADYRPAEFAADKIKKTGRPAALSLVPTEDILARLGSGKQHQILVGFTAETRDLLTSAREKMERKHLDLIVANDVSQGVFGEDVSTVHILKSSGEIVTIENRTKLEIAHRILDLAVHARGVRASGSPSH